MRIFVIAAGAVLAAWTLGAWAQERASVDADGDGWITRTEAAAAIGRVFDRLDVNGDGRLTSEDRDLHMTREGAGMEVLEGGARRITVRAAERRARAAEQGAREAERDARRIEVLRGGPGSEVSIRVPPLPPHPPHPPLMMLLASTDEADADGDGAVSRTEFLALQLRFFDASDVNGDGRVRALQPPEPPTPPEAPIPPRR